jgi:hypothetical protein
MERYWLSEVKFSVSAILETPRRPLTGQNRYEKVMYAAVKGLKITDKPKTANKNGTYLALSQGLLEPMQSLVETADIKSCSAPQGDSM